VDEITRVCQSCSDVELQPMTVMASLLRTEDEVLLLTSLSCLEIETELCVVD